MSYCCVIHILQAAFNWPGFPINSKGVYVMSFSLPTRMWILLTNAFAIPQLNHPGFPITLRASAFCLYRHKDVLNVNVFRFCINSAWVSHNFSRGSKPKKSPPPSLALKTSKTHFPSWYRKGMIKIQKQSAININIYLYFLCWPDTEES